MKNDMEMTLEADIHAYDHGSFTLPSGAVIESIKGKWGCYQITFTDSKKYPSIEVQCNQEVDGKFPENVTVYDDEHEEHYEQECDTIG